MSSSRRRTCTFLNRILYASIKVHSLYINIVHYSTSIPLSNLHNNCIVLVKQTVHVRNIKEQRTPVKLRCLKNLKYLQKKVVHLKPPLLHVVLSYVSRERLCNNYMIANLIFLFHPYIFRHPPPPPSSVIHYL